MNNFFFSNTRRNFRAIFKWTIGNEAQFKALIFNWITEFSRYRKNLSDDVREGRQRSAVTPEHIDAVREVIASKSHMTYGERKSPLNILRARVCP